VATLGEGTHDLSVRTVGAAGGTFNESPPVSIAVPEGAVEAYDPAVSGEVHNAMWGDWLIKLAERYYGDPDMYTLILDGTNAKAAVDSTFSPIGNPNLIYTGQKLWIPAKPPGR